jgi:hypothetical protein
MLAEVDKRCRRPGDCLQLKPIANKSLASTLPSPGRELWLRFTSAVFLRTNMRAAVDPAFAALLERVRNGACSDADVALINTRLLSPANMLDCSASFLCSCRATVIVRRSIAARLPPPMLVERLASAVRADAHTRRRRRSF